MPLSKHYQPNEIEPRWVDFWQKEKIYHYDLLSRAPVFSIDTPPPTVSGNLHLGHVYSYTHADIIARFWRMRGHNVYYPMGYDDNGLPTERLVEKQLGITAQQVGRREFIEQCLLVSEAAIHDYQALWLRAGLSIDWRYTYRTIDTRSRRISQLSFIQLYQQGLVYRRESPAIWCPECRTSIAQADLNDLERQSELSTLAFQMDSGEMLPIATTRPELLPACVAVFVHPEDHRYHRYVDRQARVPQLGQLVPVIADPSAEPEKGTGAVMCCTFGDATDVSWWYRYQLPVIAAIGPDGRMTQAAGKYQGLSIEEARQQIKQDLERDGNIIDRRPVTQSIRVHERCDTPVEYTIARQWFIRILEHKELLLQLGDQVRWHPEKMKARYKSWVENLSWDWCISRQRYYGVPFPLWYCQECGEVVLADVDRLPVDPNEESPDSPCACGSNLFIPETDIFDTWATSSMTPQIVGHWLDDSTDSSTNGLYQGVFPFTLRPQAHEIIRTWAFYTLVKSQYHFQSLPWKNVLISGWGLAGEGMGKISKSRGGGPMAPMDMIQRYSADAVRYWAASTSPGKDTVISEEKIKLGAKLVTKLWNVARFAEPFILQYHPPHWADGFQDPTIYPYTPADRWILSRLQRLIVRSTTLLEAYDYATAKSEIENFFWQDLADNYLEMCKLRLYGPPSSMKTAGFATIYQLLLTTIHLFAPFLPFITEEIYRRLFWERLPEDFSPSIHRSSWPLPNPTLEDETAEVIGEHLLAIVSAVRRFKSEHSLPLGADLNRLKLSVAGGISVPIGSSPENTIPLAQALAFAELDLRGATRARQIDIVPELDPDGPNGTILDTGSGIQLQIDV